MYAHLCVTILGVQKPTSAENMLPMSDINGTNRKRDLEDRFLILCM